MRRLYSLGIVTAVLVLTLSLASPAWAVRIFQGLTVQEASEILSDMGYSTKRKTTSSGSPMISFRMEDLKVGMYFYSQRGSDYRSIQLAAGFAMSDKPSLDSINAWNRTKRYGRAYLDRVGDPMVEADMDVEGVTQQAIEEFIRTFRTVLKAYVDHVDFR